MSIKVLIERVAKPGQGNKIPALLRELRSDAVRQKGYLYGETLHSMDKAGIFLVVSTWSDLAAWKRWSKDPARKHAEALLAPYLAQAPLIRIFEEYFDNAAAISRQPTKR